MSLVIDSSATLAWIYNGTAGLIPAQRGARPREAPVAAGVPRSHYLAAGTG